MSPVSRLRQTTVPVIKDGHAYVIIAALPGRAAGCSLFLTSGGQSLSVKFTPPPEEELQPEPSVPGVIGAEEDLVLAHILYIHGQPSSFFS